MITEQTDQLRRPRYQPEAIPRAGLRACSRSAVDHMARDSLPPSRLLQATRSSFADKLNGLLEQTGIKCQASGALFLFTIDQAATQSLDYPVSSRHRRFLYQVRTVEQAFAFTVLRQIQLGITPRDGSYINSRRWAAQLAALFSLR